MPKNNARKGIQIKQNIGTTVIPDESPPIQSSPSSIANDAEIAHQSPIHGDLAVTLVHSQRPAQLNKVFTWTEDGLTKTASAQLTRGRCERRFVADLNAFAELLDGIAPNVAVLYGVTERATAPLVSTKHFQEEGDAITRTRRFFGFRRAPGLMMLDHDPHGDRRLSPDDLITALHRAAPVLQEASLLWRPSASSGVVLPDGTETGLQGQRLYLPVTNAALIPEAGKALEALLWANGDGWIEVGKAGQALTRTLIDTTVWQPERLDFVAPPTLKDGLTRRAPPACLIGDSNRQFDLQTLIDLADGTIRAQAAANIKAAKSGKSDALTLARDAWIEEQAAALAEKGQITLESARATLRTAATQFTLTGDFRLLASDGAEVSVGTILDNPSRWHGKRFADPLEPEYSQDRRIAWVNLRSGGRPYLWSHAHGGRRFYLVRPSKRVRLVKGERGRVVDNCLDLLRERGELFDFGEGAALVRMTEDARAVPVSRDWLVDHFDRTIRFYVEVLRKEDGVDVVKQEDTDAPTWAASRILAKDGERGLSRLNAVITAPTLRADGSILSAPGYDAPSRLLLLSNVPELPHVPLNPSLDDARRALARLWAPVAEFPLVDAVARGVTLAAMLTACIRASLTTAPGFAWDAPAAGTGKTLLAQTIGVLLSGDIPPALPPASAQDEEARKRLFSALRENHRTILWDNIREPFGNAALDAFLTAPTFTDRILGKSETATLPNRALFLATGNNLRLVGDTCRRILIARLDAQTEKPYAREFDFDPAQMAVARRDELVVAALTLIRTWITAGRSRLGAGRTASFETWDELVRQPVCWVASWSQTLSFDDPLKATERAFEADPETAKLGALLEAVRAMTEDASPTSRGTISHTVAQMIAWANAEQHDDSDAQREARQSLHDALSEIAAERSGTINPRILGRWIERNAERRVSGLRFVQDGELRRAKRWRVVADVSSHVEINSQKHTNSHPKDDDARRPTPWDVGAECEFVSSDELFAGARETGQVVEGEL